MKKLTATVLAALMLLSAAGCAKDDKTIDTTTATTDTIVTTVTTTETTVMTTVETEETTVETTETTEITTEAEPIDPEEFLKDCVVYDVTMESYLDRFYEIDDMDESEKPKRIALRFTDAEELMLLVETDWYNVRYIINDKLTISTSSRGNFYLDKRGRLPVEYRDGITIVSHCGDYNIFADYYIMCNNQYYYIENESGYTLEISLTDEGEIKYYKQNRKFVVNNMDALIMAYESDDDFYSEEGLLSFENGEIKYKAETVKTFGESGWSNDSAFADLYKKHGVTTFAELKAVYEKLMEEGRISEFYGNE